MIKRSKKTLSKNRMIAALDKDARQQVFERDGHKCIRCSSTSLTQWAHVFSRRHPCIRWEPDNAMTLCAGCHLFWHHEPALAMDWYFKNFRDRFERMQRVLQLNPKVRVKDLYDELRAVAAVE